MGVLRTSLFLLFSFSAQAQDNAQKLRDQHFTLDCSPQYSWEKLATKSSYLAQPIKFTIEQNYKIKFDQKYDEKYFELSLADRRYYFKNLKDFRNMVQEKVRTFIQDPKNKGLVTAGTVGFITLYAASPEVRDSIHELDFSTTLNLDKSTKTKLKFFGDIEKPKFTLASGHYEFTYAPNADSLNPRSSNWYRYRLMYKIRL